jgi:hypothetical protein
MGSTGSAVDTVIDVMPFSAPAYPKSWECVQASGVHVAFTTDQEAAEQLLSGMPFELLAPRAWAYAGRLVGHGLAPAQEAWHYFGLYLPVRFRDVIGRCPIYMYVDNVEAILAGRELLGEPKKWADFQWEQAGSRLTMEASRYGRKLVSLESTIGSRSPDTSPFADLLSDSGEAVPSKLSDLTFRSIPSPTPGGTAVQDVIVNPPEGTNESTVASLDRFEMFSGRDDEPWLTLDPLGDVPINEILGTYWQTTSFVNGQKTPNPAVAHRIQG